MEGGYPVMIDGTCVGAIGVAGADWQTDARIASVALESIDSSGGIA